MQYECDTASHYTAEYKERFLSIIGDNTDLLDKAAEENPVIREILDSDRDGVDYSAEYRKQTGRDLESGDIVVQ